MPTSSTGWLMRMQLVADMHRLVILLAIFVVAACSKNTPPPDEAEVQPGFDFLQVEILLGASAKRLCSSIFVSGRDQAEVLGSELNDSNTAQMMIDVDRDAGVVETRILGQVTNVLHRPGLGCTLVKGTTIEALREQFDADAYPAVTTFESAWPIGDTVVLPATVDGIDLEAVNSAVDKTFDDIVEGQEINTRGVVVAHRGRIIAEKYAAPFDAGVPQLGWSMTKTVTGALTGILVGDGRLEVDAPAGVDAWSSAEDPRQAVTLSDLLHMSSGLEFSEVYTAGSVSDVIVMLYARADTGGFAASKALAFEPGARWSYSSGTTNVISRIQRARFASQQDYFNFPRERLFNRLGMSSAVLEPDASGVFVGSSYMYATPRDWAKIGQLYLDDGVWNGERILPEGWVEFSLTPANAAPRGNYGAQVWLNRGGGDGPPPREDLPPSMFYLSGFEGQNVAVVPELELVVVRMGLTRSGPRPIWNLVRDVVAANLREPE